MSAGDSKERSANFMGNLRFGVHPAARRARSAPLPWSRASGPPFDIGVEKKSPAPPSATAAELDVARRAVDERVEDVAGGEVDVRGDDHWSIHDNFEWSLGFTP